MVPLHSSFKWCSPVNHLRAIQPGSVSSRTSFQVGEKIFLFLWTNLQNFGTSVFADSTGLTMQSLVYLLGCKPH